MSLFPAYSDDTVSTSSATVSKHEPDESEQRDWLENSSYSSNIPAVVPSIDLSSDSCDESTTDNLHSETHSPLQSNADIPLQSNTDILLESNVDSFLEPETESIDETKSKHLKKRKKEKRRHSICSRKKSKQDYAPDVKDVYFEDKYRDKGNNTVITLCSRARALYTASSTSLGFIPRKHSGKVVSDRYYTKNLDLVERQKKKETVIRKDTVKNVADDEDNNCSWLINAEELQKGKIKECNERLSNEPNNVPLWIEYIEFQDNLHSLLRYKSVTDGTRSNLTKKLSIAEKAIEKNPESIDLLKLKLSLMGELLPADQFSNELESMVNKSSGSDVLWKAFIMVTQTSVAMCTVPKVLELYSKCFCVLKQKARTNTRVYDDRLLEMLYWCLTFLRHTGLWEQMWETIRLNLNLNLSLNKNSLSFQKTIDEKRLIGMEEVILLSRLPLNQLWQRIESLRENCHWISVSREDLELVGDSRRFILPEDVADFVHPILSRDSNFRMAIYSLLSLKVPLLPTRDCMLKALQLKQCEWSIDSSEALLPFFYPAVGEMAFHTQRKETFRGIIEGRLTSGPQYMVFHPAQESYLDFIREVFRTIAESLPLPQRTSIYVWWLRFERILVFIQKEDPLKYDNKGKKLKTSLKEFLKRESNRNNLHFYREYALIEREMNRFESCTNILQTAIQSQSTCPSALATIDERAALLSLYRTYIETLLSSAVSNNDYKAQIISMVEQIVPGHSDNQLLLVEEYLESCMQQFLQEPPSVDEWSTFFMPDYNCDTIICYTYILYIKHDFEIKESMRIFDCCINHCKECPSLQEYLYEAKIALLQLHCEKRQETQSILDAPVREMLNMYPDNFFALSLLAYLESELPIWKFNTQSTKLTIWRAIAMCLASRRRIHYLKQCEDPVSSTAAINKLLSFHQTLSRIPTAKSCPLLWRLLMLLLRENDLCEKKGEEIYHQSVGQCPWTRGIYIDAAEIAPQVLTQIQDVIREKELRMHVTPEELDILRN